MFPDLIDKISYEEEYRNKTSELINCEDRETFVRVFENSLQPFFLGGLTKGYVRGLAVSKIIEQVLMQNTSPGNVTILDCGCGLGELSVFLSAHGFKVIGIDISEEGIKACKHLAEKFECQNCHFYAANLDNIPVRDHSIDFVIGHASLHHFIKYPDIPKEFKRVMKPAAKGFFADSFGENKLYHLFHDKKKMKKLGDVVLTSKLIEDYFKFFEVKIIPTDWFVMLDKLYLKIIPERWARKLSRYHFMIDRKINPRNRINLYLAGAVLTEISNGLWD